MAERAHQAPLVIADAGPLIGLARVDGLGLLRQLFQEIWITPAVLQELQLDQRNDAPEVSVLTAALSDGWITIHGERAGDFAPLNPGVDPGEASAISLGLHLQNAGHAVLLLIDDRAGRAEARHHNLTVTGTAGVAVLAEQEGLIPSAVDLLKQLRETGYYLSDGLLNAVAERTAQQDKPAPRG